MFERFFITHVPDNAEVGSYNYVLVLVSYLVASLASYTAFILASNLIEEKTRYIVSYGNIAAPLLWAAVYGACIL